MSETVTVAHVHHWLESLCEDDYPEDRIYIGDPDQPVTGVVVCWFANAGARAATKDLGADLVLTHETPWHQPLLRPTPQSMDWPVNVAIRRFYEREGVALIRCHRTLDAAGIPDDFAAALDLGEPVVAQGERGYRYVQVYETDPAPLPVLAARFRKLLGLPPVRTSAADPDRPVRRLGIAWGGVSLSANMAVLEMLREHGAEAIVGGEVDEYALEYMRDVGLPWIELGHYASEIVGLRRVAQRMAARFPALAVHCYDDPERICYV